MARFKVEWSERARRELLDIYDFIVESGNPLTALRYIDRIERRCEEIGDHPYSGRAREEVRKGMRSIPFESVILLYTVADDTVTISNIIYGGRDYGTLLRDKD